MKKQEVFSIAQYIPFTDEQKRRASAIDLLSYITLHPDRWREHSYVACCRHRR